MTDCARPAAAAAGSTTYARCASGYARLSARITGVVNITSPISRSLSNRIFTRPDFWRHEYSGPTRVSSRFDRGLVDEHDRNVVLDGIHAVALRALERGAILHQIDLRLALRARKNLEQLWIDHRVPIARPWSLVVGPGRETRDSHDDPADIQPHICLGGGAAVIIVSGRMPIAPAALVWLATASPAVGPQPPAPSQTEAQADQPTAGYYFVLGRYLEGEGQIPAAIDALKQAIQLEPKSAEPRAELAALYARQDRANEAIAAAEDALKVDPQNREANRILGSVLAALSEQRGRYAGAARC